MLAFSVSLPGPEGLESKLFRLAIPQAEAIEVVSSEFEAKARALAESGAAGVLAVGPLKVNAARIAERYYTVPHSLGVANVLMFRSGIFGQNTEVPGFSAALRDVEPSTALLLGAGTGARMAAMSLLLGGWRLRVWNRTATKSRLLANALASVGKIELLTSPDPSGCTLVVNATSLGKRAGEEPPMDWTRALPKTIAYDLVYRQVATEFLRKAALRGFRSIDGRESIVEAVSLAAESITDLPVEREVLRLAAGLKPSIS